MEESVLLTKQGKDQLRTWLGKRVKFTTLYRLTRDGVSATVFHQLCNGKGATVTVAKLAAGNIFGGYTALPWMSTGAYRNDPAAFLFNLYTGANFSPLRVAVRDAAGTNAIYDIATHGPTFGNAPDLIFFTNTALGCATNISGGHGYVLPPGGAFILTGANTGWTVVELEVIDVSQLETMLPHPWVPVNWTTGTRDELKKIITSYVPRYSEKLEVKYANILVIGGTGAGKTSLLSTFASVMMGRMTSVSARGTGTDSLTLSLLKHMLDGAPGLRLWDSKGWSPSTYRSGEMNYIVDGNIPHGFSLQQSITPDIPGFVQKPKFSQKVHVIFVLAADDMASDDVYITRVREFVTLARLRAIPVVIGLTKVDRVDSANLENETLDGSATSNVFRSVAIQDVIRKLATATGIDANYIVPIKSYCKEYEYSNNVYVDILALLALKKLTECADDCFISKWNTQLRAAEDCE